jgi:hypothetical protein
MGTDEGSPASLDTANSSSARRLVAGGLHDRGCGIDFGGERVLEAAGGTHPIGNLCTKRISES